MLAVVGVVLGTASAAGARANAATIGSWRRAPSMLYARSAHSVVTLGGNIYALAGSGTNGPVLQVERFDDKSWTVETTLPGGGLNASVGCRLRATTPAPFCSTTPST
jgi:hypothetical protein